MLVLAQTTLKNQATLQNKPCVLLLPLLAAQLTNTTSSTTRQSHKKPYNSTASTSYTPHCIQVLALNLHYASFAAYHYSNISTTFSR